jgi:hypothetical protein
MIGRRNLIVPILLALAMTQANGQSQAPDADTDPKEALQQLLSKALSVTISARIVPPDADTTTAVWNAESTKLTLPGRSIKVRLEGENVRIYLVCTPYVQADGEVLLLAQGQVWLTEPTDKENKYYNTFYTIPVSFGEKVLFFPLGLSDADNQDKKFFNVELEIKIVPYEQKQ